MRAVIHIFLSPVLERDKVNPSYGKLKRYINCSVTDLAMSENIY